MAVFCIEISRRQRSPERAPIVRELRQAGFHGIRSADESTLYFVEGALQSDDAERLAVRLLQDPVVERARVCTTGEPADRWQLEVHLRPGVMNPTAETALAEFRAEGFPVEQVRTARRFRFEAEGDPATLLPAIGRTIANDCIEQVVFGSAGVHPAARAPLSQNEKRLVAIRGLNDVALERLSRDAHLFLSLEEMRAIQTYFAGLNRDPTDLEVETLAQTWSEHCVHKTLKSAVHYRGAGFGLTACHETVERRFENLLKDTIARATHELIAEGRGPRCLSVFVDNAGVIAFDDELAIAFKVETHNHPSAIEPYGGAATGVGGCIRDVIGCGLAARPIANTDVFCVAPGDWPGDALPKGVLHPARVLRGVVAGVADYGNRMGIPTVNGAVYFDPRFLGNPLVFCGCVGLIPRDRVEKRAAVGDWIVLVGGRTGRDGIHGATFSSAELSDSHADEFSHAVQIGNAITEKRVLDGVLAARDHADGCLFSAITDCGAGGLSSAVGEMAATLGAVVDLERVPLKYAGLRYDEIWISEAQERMVLAVPPARLEAFLDVMRSEEVEATVIGRFGDLDGKPCSTSPRLIVRYHGEIVGDLDLTFLHDGVPRRTRAAEWSASPPAARSASACATSIRVALLAHLARPTAAAKEWIIRRYDHEVQGGTLVKPLMGPGRGPTDAAVLRPKPTSRRGIALGCGLAPHLSDRDPYWMALAAIDEAIRNVVCVGGDPHQTAVLDNFCWGRCDEPIVMGELVRACQGCYDAAMAYGTPYISGKDSLNNEFALDAPDVETLIQTLTRIAAAQTPEGHLLAERLPQIVTRLRRTGRLAIPSTLLISAVALVPDVDRACTSDLKQPGSALLVVGGFDPAGYDPRAAARVHAAVAEAIAAGRVRACHDVSDGGWLAALAEMMLGGRRGARIEVPSGPFDERTAAYVVEVGDDGATWFGARGVPQTRLGEVIVAAELQLGDERIPVADLDRAWRGAE